MRLSPRFAAVLAALASIFSVSARAADLAGSISYGTMANNFNMTTMNGEVGSVIDWIVWGEGDDTNLAGSNRKSGGTAISALNPINPKSQPLRGLGQFNLGETFQWSDGSPTASGFDVQTGIQFNNQFELPEEALGSGFSFQVQGSSTQTMRLFLWVGQHMGTSTFTGSLNGATQTSHTLNGDGSGDGYALLTYDFKPNSNSDLLTIQGVVTGVEPQDEFIYTNNYWFAAAVGVITPVPEPSTYALAGLSAIALFVVARQRRRNDLKPAV